MWYLSSVLILLSVLKESVSEYCYDINEYCTYGCCSYRCCDDNDVSGVVIAFAIIGSILGIAAIIALVCCFIRRRGYSGTVFRSGAPQQTPPYGQTAVVTGQTPFVTQQTFFAGGSPGYVIRSPGVNTTVIQTNTVQNPAPVAPTPAPGAPIGVATAPPPYGFMGQEKPGPNAPPPPYPGM